eukprot:CAMPEP_0185764016 /NCGR_PEP_ID=MMETSP1174-20130828/22915_1 /TAXON_ID=35687 /ORGANISM="Dictyocha speculum, Strain CCMP1381" /LENGTH=86 /DNA_ID=CAMNT_0028446361 /DNA_START=286 /DNA_END=543 /DNA_ORIENTATION=+
MSSSQTNRKETDSHSRHERSESDRIVNALADFRTQVRRRAISAIKDKSQLEGVPQELLRECDILRDDILPEHGISLEDTGAGGARW